MKQCEYEKTRKLVFVVHTRDEKRRKEKKRREKGREEKRGGEERHTNCEILDVKSSRYFRMLQTEKNRRYTEPNKITHTWKIIENSSSWLARQPTLGSTILPQKHERSR